MDWVVLSICSAALFAIVNVLDKFILTRISPSAPTFIVLLGLLQLPAAISVLLVAPPGSHPAGVWATAYAAGFLWGAAIVVMFWVMSKQEVSRVMPVIATSPVFVALLSVAFLSEELTALHWAAIGITVAGAVLISLRLENDSGGGALGQPFLLLLLASGLTAAGQFLSKVALDDMTLWELYPLRALGLASACVLIPIRPSVFREARQIMSDRLGRRLMVVTEGVLAPLAALLTLWAILLGPVSLAVTVMSTRSMFIFVFSAIVSTPLFPILHEPLDRGTLATKFIFIAMILSGVGAISLL